MSILVQPKPDPEPKALKGESSNRKGAKSAKEASNNLYLWLVLFASLAALRFKGFELFASNFA